MAQSQQEIHRLTSQGVDVVFDSIGGAHIWRSRKALRSGGKVVAYGLTGSLRGGRLASGRSGGRHRFREIRIFALYIAGGSPAAGPETGGSLQHPDAQTAETGTASTEFDRPV